MAFLDLTSELAGMLPGLSPLLAERYVNRAYAQIRSERLWSFLVMDGVVVCPAQVTTGSAAIVQYSASVTLNAAASAALLAQTAVGAVPGLTNMAIRFGATSPAIGQVYTIEAANITVPTAIVLTLNRVVVEATNTASGYQCYRPYITPPISDFLKWESVVDMVNAFSLVDGRINYTSKDFDRRDPQRQAQGFAYSLGNFMGAYVPDPTTGVVVDNPNVNAGSNLYELWPHPTSGQTFYTRFRRTGTDFLSADDTQPTVIPDELIIHRALGWHAYPFAAANVASFPTFKGANWLALIQLEKAAYKDVLLSTKKQDEEAAPQNVFARGHGLRAGGFDFKGMSALVADANWLQSHLVNF